MLMVWALEPELLHDACQSLDAQTDAGAASVDIHTLVQKPDNARLLGREELVPERVELQECVRTTRWSINGVQPDGSRGRDVSDARSRR